MSATSIFAQRTGDLRQPPGRRRKGMRFIPRHFVAVRSERDERLREYQERAAQGLPLFIPGSGSA